MKQNIKFRKHSSSHGFTIVELLVIIVIVGVLAAISMVSYSGITARAKTVAAQSNAKSAQQVAEAMNAQLGHYPDTAASFSNGALSKLPPSINVLTGADTLNGSNGENSILWSYDGTVGASTGGTIRYWDFTTAAISTNIIRVGTGIGSTPTNVLAVASGRRSSYFLAGNGRAWSVGRNSKTELGLGISSPYETIPTYVVGPGGSGYLDGIVSVGGEYHTVALKDDGTVWAWGDNQYGQLGNGTFDSDPHSAPEQVVGDGGTGHLTNVKAVAASRGLSIAVKNDGTVWAWGLNDYGQLGQGTVDNPDVYQTTPVQVLGEGGAGYLTNVKSVTTGEGFSVLALKNDGTVWAWGVNWSGQLGNGNNTDSSTPVQVLGEYGIGNLDDVKYIASGQQFSVALKNDGTVWAWGINWSGQLGNDSIDDSNTPIQASVITDITKIASSGGGNGHCLALKGDGTVWAWGSNEYGQLGIGASDSDPHPTPVQVNNISGVTSISLGYSHSLALKGDGTFWGWGLNSHGQLGLGNTDDQLLPAVVPGITASVGP